MIELLRTLLFSESPNTDPSLDLGEVEVVAAALLEEVASIDGDYSEFEQQTILGLLSKKFDMDRRSVRLVMEEAKIKIDTSVDLFSLTNKINKAFDSDGRVQLMEMLWEVIYADGILEDFEANLMRRLAGLLYVSDRESGEARKRVLERLG